MNMELSDFNITEEAIKEVTKLLPTPPFPLTIAIQCLILLFSFLSFSILLLQP